MDKEISYWKYHFAFWNMGKIHLSVYSFSLLTVVGRVGLGVIKDRALWAIVWLVNLLLLGRTLWLTKGRKQLFSDQLAIEFSLFVVLCLLISPWVCEPHYVVLYLPLLVCWLSMAEVQARHYFLMFIIGYLLLGLKYSLVRFPFFNSGLPALLTGLKLGGCLVLFLLLGDFLQQQKFFRFHRKG